MVYLKTFSSIYSLGNNIFQEESSGRYILCTTDVQAQAILCALGLPSSKIKQCASINDASDITHTSGQRVSIVHRGKQYVCDTLLALGVPRGVDTTKPVTLIYRRLESDVDRRT